MREVAKNLTDLTAIINKVHDFAKKNGYPIEIKCNGATSKRLAQLGGLFGVWVKEYSDYTGEGQNEIHKKWKRQFLERIYIANTIGPLQEQWVELMCVYQEAGDYDKLEKQRDRISLSWAKVSQMSDYMNAVFEDCTDKGIFLSPLEKEQ